MKPTLRVLLTFALASAVFLTGCGKKDQPPAPKSDTEAARAAAMTVPPGGAPTTVPGAATPTSSSVQGRAIEITANDQMKFSTTEIHAKPGEALSVTLKNVGTVPKFSMGHNWVLLQSTAVVEPFIAEAPQAAATDYIPASQQKNIIAHTKLLGPKEQDTANFKAPEKPGRYPYVCSFPGHYQVGMHGELIVE